MQVRWIIQNNLVSEDVQTEIQKTLNLLNVEFVEIIVIPFSSEMPIFPVDTEHINVYYGATTLMFNVYRQFNKPPGLFFNENFSMKNYLTVWGEYMLNSEAIITTFADFSQQAYPADSLWFVRPDADDKSFVGSVYTFDKLQNWITAFTKSDTIVLTDQTKIVVGPPYNIKKEWRNYIVNGQVITSSLYRENFKLKKNRQDVPQDMLDFVTARCQEYMPHACFAMDVALCGDQYYIIECGCLNSVGFYAADVPKLIQAITEYASTL